MIDCMPKNVATRKYARRFTPAMILYVVFLWTAVWTFRHHHPTGIVAYVLAILPALPILATIVIVGLYLAEEQDEFQRNILIQSMLWGIGLSMGIMTVWGFLELLVGIPHFDAYLAYPLFWFIVGLTTPLLKRKYR